MQFFKVFSFQFRLIIIHFLFWNLFLKKIIISVLRMLFQFWGHHLLYIVETHSALFNFSCSIWNFFDDLLNGSVNSCNFLCFDFCYPPFPFTCNNNSNVVLGIHFQETGWLENWVTSQIWPLILVLRVTTIWCVLIDLFLFIAFSLCIINWKAILHSYMN